MYHKDLEVWKISVDLVIDIYKITENFPKNEIFGLTAQMRRSAVSVPSNIAEGCGRYSDKDTLKFIYVALGSLSELETQIIIAQKLGYLDEVQEIYNSIKKVNAMLIGLKKRITTDIN